MPFPDGTGMAGDLFTPIHQQNSAELRGAPAPAYGGAVPIEGAEPVAPPDAGIGMPTFGAHPDAVNPRTGSAYDFPQTAPDEAFGPSQLPEYTDTNGVNVQLAGLDPDGQVNLAAGVGAAVNPTPMGGEGEWTNRPDVASMHLAVSAVDAPATKPPNLRAAVDGRRCSSCSHFKNGKCAVNGNYEVKPDQVSDDYSSKNRNLGQEGGDAVHLAVIFQQQPGMDLAVEREPGGLVQKVICVTGTLALSPGPGQVDVEKPLSLTPDMFMSIKKGFDDGAFPHVTVPETHANGALENTGYVRTLEIKDAHDPTLPPEIADAYKDWPGGTQLMMAGIEFTEPEIRQKALNGSIPDTSVGVKFNYRNKRTGTTYPHALEHVALTPVPWVDGLTPFGNTLLSGQPFDAEADAGTWDGVFIDAPTLDLAAKKRADAKKKDPPEDEPDPGKGDDNETNERPDITNHGELVDAIVAHAKKPSDKLRKHIQERAIAVQGTHLLPEDIADHGSDDDQEDKDGKKLAASAASAGGILSPEQEDGSLHPTLSPTGTHQETDTQMPPTVEELLAQQQARAEAQEAEIARLRGELQSAGTQLSAQASSLWSEKVDRDVAVLQDAGCSPDFCNRVKTVKLAAGPQIAASGEDGLSLSVPTGATEAGQPTTLQLSGLDAVIDYLAAGVPTKGGAEVTRMLALSSSLDRQASERKSDEQRAKESVDAYEKDKHPERFNDDGTRKVAATAA